MLEKKLINTIKFSTPNLYELREITKELGLTLDSITSLEELSLDDVLQETIELAKFLADLIENVIVTLGHHGLVVITKRQAHEPYFNESANYIRRENGSVKGRFYASRKINNIVNVSGAGDSFTSGFLSALIRGLPEDNCIDVGMEAASKSLGNH